MVFFSPGSLQGNGRALRPRRGGGGEALWGKDPVREAEADATSKDHLRVSANSSGFARPRPRGRTLDLGRRASSGLERSEIPTVGGGRPGLDPGLWYIWDGLKQGLQPLLRSQLVWSKRLGRPQDRRQIWRKGARRFLVGTQNRMRVE